MRFARAGWLGASAGEAWIAWGHSTACSATSLGLRATRRCDLIHAVPHSFAPTLQQTSTPNQALQRTTALAFSFRTRLWLDRLSHGTCSTAKPGRCRAFASRRFRHEGASGLRSLSLGSLGDLPHVP